MKLKILGILFLSLFIAACSQNNDIESATSGTVSTDIQPTIIFKNKISDEVNKIYTSNGEIKVNSRAFLGQFMFSDERTLVLLFNEPLQANSTHKIELDFKAINENTNSKIESKNFKFDFKTNAIEARFLDVALTSNGLDKMQLSANLELSDSISLDSVIKNLTLETLGKQIELNISEISPRLFSIMSLPLNKPEANQTFNLALSKNIGTKDNISVPYDFIKREELNIIGINAKNENIEILFSSPLAKNANLKDFIKLTPNINFNLAQSDNSIILSGRFYQHSNYTLDIASGIKGLDNLMLKENISREISFQDAMPQIVFANDGVFMPDSNRKKLIFSSINVKKAEVVIRKIHANNITHALNNNNFSIKGSSDFRIYEIENLSDEIARQEIIINAPKNEWIQNEIDLNFIKNDNGIFIISMHFNKDDIISEFPQDMENWRVNNYFYENGNINKEIIFSNLAIIAHQFSIDNKPKILASAIDIATNKPLNNITLQSINKKHQIIQQANSSDGMAILDAKDEFGNEADYIIANSKNDFAILKLSANQISNDGFDTGGNSAQNGIKTYIYTERGVYRPGDSININIIARNNNEPIAHPIELEIINSRNKKIIKQSLENLGDGIFHYEFHTNKADPSGIYELKVNVGDNVFNHAIPIETIIPNRIKAEISAQDEIDLNKEKNIKVSIQSDYLFGAPASGLNYEINAEIYPKKFISKKYADWIFDNPTNLIYRDSKNINGQLNENGFTSNEIALNKQYSKNLEALITARIYEKNGRFITQRKKIALNVFDSFIGIKSPKTRYIKQDSMISLPIIVLDKNENPLPNRKLKYKIYNNNYSWWFDYDSIEQYRRALKGDRNTQVIAQGELTSSNKPINLNIEAKAKGEILVELIDTSNNQSSSIFLYAQSWGEVLDMEKISQLKIKSNKDSYIQGERAKVTFESTPGAKALVVISHNSAIIERYFIDTNDFQSTIEIPIDEQYAPNIYASVFLLQHYNNIDNDRALRLYGTIPLKIINPKTKLNIELESSDKILPNSTLNIKIKNKENRQATYTLAVIDNGILDLTNFKTPNPWDYFYAKTRLEVKHFDTFDYIIGKTIGSVDKSYAIGGDVYASSDSGAKNRDDSMAERFKSIVFFSKPFKSDESGNASVSFEFPSFLGSVRIMAIAIDKNAYGSAQKDVLVTAPIAMLPTIPRSLKVGDNFSLPIEVLPIDEVKNAEISVKSDGIISFDKKSQKLNFGDKKSKTIFFNGKVSEELGVENIILELKSGSFSMIDKTQIDIKAPNPYIFISKNYNISANTPLKVQAPSSFIKNSQNGKLTLSPQPILALDHRLLWLIAYPYGCIEQTTSSAFPQLFIDKLSKSNFVKKEQIINNINAAIARISRFQTADGGFSYWQNGGKSDAWGSAYAGHFLIMAKKNGYFVDEVLFKRWLNYMQRNILRNDIYPLYLLALSDNANLGAMNEIYENNLKNLTTTNKWLLAASYKLAGFDDIALKIARNLSIEPNEPDSYYDYSYGSKLRNKAIILESHQIIFNKINDILYNDIKNELETNSWLSTQTMSYSLLALANIKEQSNNTSLNASVTLNGKKENLSGQNAITLDLNEGEAIIESKHDMFANYTWEGITKDNKGDNIARNMRLEREFITIEPNGAEIPLDIRNLKSAQSFWMKITVGGIDDDLYLKNVALVQNLPSGWEIENLRLNENILPEQVELANSAISYTDIRDDKIMWFFDLNGDDAVVYAKINAITPGNFSLSAAYCEVMYDGSYQASSDSFRIKVTP